MTKEEYERNVMWHIEKIRLCAKQFDPKIDHISMAVTEHFEWAISYAGEDEVSNANHQHTPLEGEEDEQ